jgi:NADH-quinone oxidoreductase subunit I
MFRVIRTILAIPQGLWVIFRHLFTKPVTQRYPEVKREMPERYRGLHYLARDENGKEKCVCCGLCAAACPSGCIYMEPAENEQGERYAKVYEINELRCIFCGFCEEACPTGAIFLGKEYEFSQDKREKLIYTKEDLLVPYPERGK